MAGILCIAKSGNLKLCFVLNSSTFAQGYSIGCFLFYHTVWEHIQKTALRFTKWMAISCFIDYELSSWKYQNKDYTPSQYVKYITGELPLPLDCDITIKRGYIPSQKEEKGMGSAYGGEWQPKKEEDKRFLGKPGETKTTTSTNSKGETYTRKTHIGDDGKADFERHNTDHGKPSAHSNPMTITLTGAKAILAFANLSIILTVTRPH